jgi:hypothetical protein
LRINTLVTFLADFWLPCHDLGSSGETKNTVMLRIVCGIE